MVSNASRVGIVRGWRSAWHARRKRLYPSGLTVRSVTIGIPYNVVPATQKKVRVSFYYGDESDRGPYAMPVRPKLEWGSDHHVLIVQTGTCKLYELYDVKRAGGKFGNLFGHHILMLHVDKGNVNAKPGSHLVGITTRRVDQMLAEDGRSFEAPIPLFTLSVPRILH